MKSLLLAVSAVALLMCLASTPVTAQQRDGAAPAAPRRQPQLVAVCANSQSDPTTDAAGLCHRPDRRPARSVAAGRRRRSAASLTATPRRDTFNSADPILHPTGLLLAGSGRSASHPADAAKVCASIM